MSEEKTMDEKQLDMLRMIADTHHRTECASWKLLWLIDQHRALTAALATALRERDAARVECERLRGEVDRVDGMTVAEAEHKTAEAIAAWLDAKAKRLEATLASIPDNERNRERRDEFGWGASYTSGAAADIRSGKWRTP